jgi:hypothetical protein
MARDSLRARWAFTHDAEAAGMTCLHRFAACWLLALCAIGCGQAIRPGKSPLAPPKMSPDSVVLEVFFVRVPFDDPEANQTLWKQIDEQRLELAVRGRLAENGFRVGLVQGQLPRALERWMGLSSRPPTGAEAGTVQLGEDSPVSRAQLQNRAGQRKEIVASGMYEAFPVLMRKSGDLVGETYPKGQGVLAIKSYPQGDGRVRVEVQPELQYGEMKQNWVGNQGVLQLEVGRSKLAFEQLAFEATLSAGEVLVLACLPQRPGSLGHYFLSQSTGGKLEQKLLLIRLAQTQYDDLFSTEAPTVPAE